MRQIAFHRPSIGPDEEREVLDTLRSGWITTGPKAKRFEAEFAGYVGAKHALALSHCTGALHLSDSHAYALIAVGRKSRVIPEMKTSRPSAATMVACEK